MTGDWVTHPAVVWTVITINVVMFVYTVALQSIYTSLTLVGWRRVDRYMRRRPLRDYDYVTESPLSVPVSILVPAFNEALTVVTSLHALLANHYQQVEVVVVNDGSTDATLTVLAEEFRLVPLPRAPRSGLVTEPVRGVYMSAVDPRVVVIDKDNGGKADALNAAINYARYPLVCSVDADTLVDPVALERLVWEFQRHPDTVATGGTVRIANGSTVRGGLIQTVSTPWALLATLQIVEYLRAFLGSRVGWSRAGMLLIVSGAFGLFRRQALVDIGGYDTKSVGEDAELVVRLYRHFSDAGQPHRVTFFPDPVCWTEAPTSWRMLARQRDRWQRGMTQLLWKHRDMTGRGRFGRLGRWALPYFWAFELAGPVIEVAGYMAIPIGVALGILNVWVAVALLALATCYGAFLSLMALLIEERTFRRYPSWTDLRRMVTAIAVENFGYRQALAVVRVRAMVRLLYTQRSWGSMARSGFTVEPGPAAGAAVPVEVLGVAPFGAEPVTGPSGRAEVR